MIQQRYRTTSMSVLPFLFAVGVKLWQALQ
jgi:hypothetical protein